MIVLGVLAGVAWFGSQLPKVSDDLDALRRTSLQGQLEFELDEAVEWTVFVEPSAAALARVRFDIVNVATGEAVPIRRSSSSFSYAWFGRSGRSIARADIPPGVYRVDLEGGVTIAIGESPGSRIAWAFGGAALLGLPLVVGGFAVAIVSAIRDTRQRTRDTEPPPPSPWSAGEWPADPEHQGFSGRGSHG